jgi:hypothetical protein
MDPNNYVSAFADLPMPGESFLAGIKGGLVLNQVQEQQRQQQAALAQQQEQQRVIRELIANPRAGADQYAAAQLLVPGMSEQLKQAWATKNTAQQQQQLSDLSQWGAAIQNKQPQIAVDAMNARADGMENAARAPTPESQALRAQARAIKEHPELGGFMIKSMLVAHPDGGKVVDAIAKLGVEDRAAAQAPADLAKKQADADAARADATLKNLGVIGQTLGSLQGKNAKPAQVTTALRTLVAKGAIGKDELPDYLAAVPSDPKQLDDWLGSMKLAGMKPDEQMRYTTPDANTVANNATSRANTAANNRTQLAVQDRIDARQESKGDTEPTLDPETLTSMAQQYLAGDKSVMQNLGRGAQGSANIVALRREITAQAKAQGMSGPAIAAKMAEFAGTMAGQRTAGTRIANVEMAANEAESLIPLARQASADVARSGLLPFGKMQMMFDNQTNDPKMRQFVAANNSLVNVYARAISPSGVPTVADKEHAREMLSTAMDHKSYLAVLDQMQREIGAARSAPQAVRKAFNGAVTGQEMHGAAPAAADHPADINALLNKYGKK